MDVKNTYKSSPRAGPSLFRGGPFYRAQLATRLIKEGEWNHGRRVVIVVAIAWVPLVLLTKVFNSSALPSLLTSYRVYSRLFIAIPVLLIGQTIMESLFQMAVQHIIDADLLGKADLIRMDRMIETLMRLRDSLIPEAIIVVLLIAHTIAALKNQLDVTPWLAYGVPPDVHPTAAGWYVILVSAAIFQFLLGLSLWKWLLWTIFAFRVSRLNLRLVATHPDGHGGLGFLGLVPVAFTPISFAAATVIGSTWRHDVLSHGSKLMSFRLDVIVLLILVAMIAIGPLAFFVPKLAELRHQGILEYGILGQIQSRNFQDKWISRRTGYEAEFLAAPESSSLANYRSSYSNIAKLKPLPVDQGVLIALAISIGLPMLPVVLTVIPLIVVIEDLLKAMR